MSFVERSLSNSQADAVAISDLNVASPAKSAKPAYDAKPVYDKGLKRIFDLALVLFTAPIWLPVILVGAMLTALDGHSPFYRQERVGRNGRTFRIWKLRTMVPNADAELEKYLDSNPQARAEWDAHQKLEHDPRITAAGRLLRKTSLDELPQLFNVVSGDMSLVGPRPMMVCQKDLYNGSRYYDLRPGLTGLWQVSDRHKTHFADRVQFDNAYAAKASLGLDLNILARTVGVVLRGTGC